MKQFINNPRDSETSSQYTDIRLAELNQQHWDRSKSENLAANEEKILSDEHWDMIQFLRNYYQENGMPGFARTTARVLNK
jgi:sulfur relay (sulfurtransferase) DsrC/TusE family protein